MNSHTRSGGLFCPEEIASRENRSRGRTHFRRAIRGSPRPAALRSTPPWDTWVNWPFPPLREDVFSPTCGTSGRPRRCPRAAGSCRLRPGRTPLRVHARGDTARRVPESTGGGEVRGHTRLAQESEFRVAGDALHRDALQGVWGSHFRTRPRSLDLRREAPRGPPVGILGEILKFRNSLRRASPFPVDLDDGSSRPGESVHVSRSPAEGLGRGFTFSPRSSKK